MLDDGHIAPRCPKHDAPRTAQGVVRLLESAARRFSCSSGRCRSSRRPAQLGADQSLVERQLACRAQNAAVKLRRASHLGEHRQKRRQRIEPSLQALPVRRLQDAHHTVLDERKRRLDDLLESVLAMLADVLVGIFAIGQAQHLDRRARRARERQCAKRRLLSGGIAVVTEAQLGCVAQQELRLFYGERRAKRGDDVLDARRRDGNRIHVALDDDREPRARDSAMGAIETEEQPPLVEDQRLGRVQILRLAVPQDAPAERHDAPACIADRNDHAVAKAVVMALAFPALRGQPALFQKRRLHAALLEGDGKLVPGRRRTADAERLDRLLADAAPCEVGFRRLAVARLGQTVVKKRLRHFLHAPKLLHLLVVRQLGCAPLPLWQRNVELFRLHLDRFKIWDILHEREKLEHIPADVAAETIKKTLFGNHRKRRRVLMVERAAAPVTVSLLLQRDIGRNDADDVGIRAHALDKGIHRLIPHAPIILCRFLSSSPGTFLQKGSGKRMNHAEHPSKLF